MRPEGGCRPARSVGVGQQVGHDARSDACKRMHVGIEKMRTCGLRDTGDSTSRGTGCDPMRITHYYGVVGLRPPCLDHACRKCTRMRTARSALVWAQAV
jgi:hypothetical protein